MSKEKELILSLSKDKGDFIVNTSRSSGKGGQNVNKLETKVRITHTKSGAVGISQTHRTQELNKREAFRRLIDSEKFQTWLKIELARLGINQQDKISLGPTGSRGEKIRTYNIPRDQVIDHRTGESFSDVESILDGNLDELINSVINHSIE